MAMTNKIIYILFSCFLLHSNLQSQEGPSVRTESRRAGSFRLGKGNTITVSGVIDKIFRPKSDYDRPITDNCVRLFNRKGRLIYKVNRPEQYCETVEYYLAQLHIPKIGYAILMTWDCEPSGPGSGAHAQLLGLNSKRQIIPLTSIMRPEADGTSPSFYEPVKVNLSKTQIDVPCFKVTQGTGYFDVPTYYVIQSDGIISEDEPPVYIDHSPISFPYYTAELKDSSHITLYKTIDDSVYNAITITISKTSKVVFLDATYTNRCWLHIQIDGHEGYISTQEDFQTLGLQLYG